MPLILDLVSLCTLSCPLYTTSPESALQVILRVQYPSFLLVRHTSTLDRLRSEIHSVLGNDQDLTRTHIQKMPYLKNVLTESP